MRAARRRGAGADPRAHPVPAPAAREAAQAQADLADRPGRPAHRRRDLHAARHRGRRRRRLAGRAGRADLGADHGGDAPAAAVHRQPEARRLAAVGAEVGVDAAELRHRHGAARARRSASGATARSASSSPATARRSACTSLVWGSEASRANAPSPTATRRRRAARRSSRPRDVLSLHLRLNDETRGIVKLEDAVAHEADGAARQHLARRADRGRRAGLGAEPRPARAWPRSTSSRASRSCRATRCCASRTRSARRTSAMSSRTATSSTSAPRSRTSSTSSTARPTNIVNPEALKVPSMTAPRATRRRRDEPRRARSAGRCCSATS